MKRGTKVAVCHDGKWGRRVAGEVIATRQGHHILVRFEFDDKVVEFWARRVPAVRYMQGRNGSYRSKRPVSYAGWADIDYFCPWFSVWKMPREEEG